MREFRAHLAELRRAREALVAGGSAPCELNAANEVAVAAFLGRQIGFLDIAAVVAETLASTPARPTTTLEQVLEIDAGARREATRLCAERGRSAA